MQRLREARHPRRLAPRVPAPHRAPDAPDAVHRVATVRVHAEGHPRLGNFASQDLYVFLRNCWKFCRELRRLSCSPVKLSKRIAEICADDESAQKLCRKTTNSWLVEFPTPARSNASMTPRKRGVSSSRVAEISVRWKPGTYSISW